MGLEQSPSGNPYAGFQSRSCSSLQFLQEHLCTAQLGLKDSFVVITIVNAAGTVRGECLELNLQPDSLVLSHSMVLMLTHHQWWWGFRGWIISCANAIHFWSHNQLLTGISIHPTWLWEKNGRNRKGGANTHFQLSLYDACRSLLFFSKNKLVT